MKWAEGCLRGNLSPPSPPKNFRKGKPSELLDNIALTADIALQPKFTPFFLRNPPRNPMNISRLPSVLAALLASFLLPGAGYAQKGAR